MKAFKVERTGHGVALLVLAGYLAVFLLVSCLQTFMARSEMAVTERRSIDEICGVAGRMSSEIPVENRDAWIDSFQKSPELILVCAEKAAMESPGGSQFSLAISETAPLSIMF